MARAMLNNSSTAFAVFLQWRVKKIVSEHRILLVDDEPRLTESLKRSLRGEPYACECVNSAIEALQLLKTRSFDLVVSDDQMPGMSGTEFLSIVSLKYPHTVRMMLTGHASLDAAVRAINEGEVYRFFTKPCDRDVLRVAIRQALQMKDLHLESRRLLEEYRRQTVLLQSLGESTPTMGNLERDASGDIVINETQDLETLLAEIESQFAPKVESSK